MAELVFFTGTMSSSKSTLALQMDYNRRATGQRGLLFTSKSREGSGVIASRLGVSAKAIELDEDTLIGPRTRLGPDYIICDEAQFYTPLQVDELAYAADTRDIPVFCFGIMTDFQTQLFPGSKRLLEIADRVEFLQLDSLCWCGQRGICNARVVDGFVQYFGEQVMVGDVDKQVGYVVLCRKHWRLGELT